MVLVECWLISLRVQICPIGEFEEVGDVVKSFTSEDATVVVGTVIDPEMTDELRVTVVVTGLGGRARCVMGSNVSINIPKNNINENTKTDGAIDYRKLDKPTVLRKESSNAAIDEADRLSAVLDKNIEYLDIPAFLRRKDKIDD